MATKKAARNFAVKAGAGVLAAAALAAAGAYLLSDKTRQRKLKAWAAKAKQEVAKHLKTASRMGEAEYKRIVDRAVKRYGGLHKVNSREVARAAQELKEEWQRIRKDAKVLAAMAHGKKKRSHVKK